MGLQSKIKLLKLELSVDIFQVDLKQLFELENKDTTQFIDVQDFSNFNIQNVRLPFFRLRCDQTTG